MRKSPTERVEEREESVWSVVRQENEREDQGEGVQNSGKTSTDVLGRDMGVEEGTGKEIGGRRNLTRFNKIAIQGSPQMAVD